MIEINAIYIKTMALIGSAMRTHDLPAARKAQQSGIDAMIEAETPDNKAQVAIYIKMLDCHDFTTPENKED